MRSGRRRIGLEPAGNSPLRRELAFLILGAPNGQEASEKARVARRTYSQIEGSRPKKNVGSEYRTSLEKDRECDTAKGL
jgi:hypothetical protein